MEDKIKELIGKYKSKYTHHQKEIENEQFIHVIEWKEACCSELANLIRDLEELLKQ